jgi:hypothetical protein
MGSCPEGFTELVTRLCTGEVGAIFGIEITRPARANGNALAVHGRPRNEFFNPTTTLMTLTLC